MRFVLCWLVVGCPTPPRDSAPEVEDSTGGTDSEGTESTPTDSEPTDTGTTYLARDDDGDGYTEREGDCDDAHASVNPSMTEDCETYADDDCHGGNDGCWGGGYWASYIGFEWLTSESEPSGYSGARFVGMYDKLVCDYGGTLVRSPDPTPSCPDCVWTFRSEPNWEDPWQYGPCRDLVNFIGSGYEFLDWFEGSWGFTFVNPEGGESSDIGWLVTNDGGVDQHDPWEVWAGPGYNAFYEYAFSTGDEAASAYAVGVNYGAFYYYWRYGEPVRDYNP